MRTSKFLTIGRRVVRLGHLDTCPRAWLIRLGAASTAFGATSLIGRFADLDRRVVISYA